MTAVPPAAEALPDDTGAAGPPPAPAPPPSLARGLLRLARPRQWVKNVLVLAAPGAAGVLDEAGPLGETALALVCFCLAASGTYFLNDARDVEADRRHPTKRHRPVASGAVPVRVAVVGGVALAAVAVGVAFSLRWQLGAVVAGYVVLTSSYSALFKHIAVVDLVAVAAGFVLRALAGGAATGVPISEWFFLVATFGSLFMVSGKRGAEAAEMGDDAAGVRSVLASYSPGYVAYLRATTSSALLLTYCLWSFEEAAFSASTVPWFQLSIVPFTMAVLRYALVLDQGRGSAPEDVVLGDRPLQAMGAVWLVVYAVAVGTA